LHSRKVSSQDHPQTAFVRDRENALFCLSLASTTAGNLRQNSLVLAELRTGEIRVDAVKRLRPRLRERSWSARRWRIHPMARLAIASAWIEAQSVNG
jgi:hypothetical protein